MGLELAGFSEHRYFRVYEKGGSFVLTNNSNQGLVRRKPESWN